MPRTALLSTIGWAELAAEQAGVIALRQLIGFGITADQGRQWVRSGRWQRLLPGIYASFTGPVSFRAQIWAVVLHAGPAAAASHRTALWLERVIDEQPALIEVVIPAHRRVRAPPGAVVRGRDHFASLIHPAGLPPRIRLEESVLDVMATMTSTEAALSLVFRVTQHRLTTPKRLKDALARRRRYRFRRLLEDVLADIQQGAASRLEQRYMRDVERAHGLPPGQRNQRETGTSGSLYRDVRYYPWRLVVELDGRGAHPEASRFRDMRRDNLVVLSGDTSLRFGRHDLAGHPCLVAAQVITVLKAHGWTGTPRRCDPACPVQ